VGGVVVLALALENRVEDDGGEVGHQVRCLPALWREVPHLCSRLAHVLELGGRRKEGVADRSTWIGIREEAAPAAWTASAWERRRGQYKK
jgi:hypothetical protein